MSVAAIGTAAPRTAQSASTPQKLGDGRPNTGNTGAMYNHLFRTHASTPQKLPVSRIPDIVARMQRDTRSSHAKRSGQWYKGDSYIDPRTYSWKNLSLYSDYQAHMWTPDGDIKSGYKK